MALKNAMKVLMSSFVQNKTFNKKKTSPVTMVMFFLLSTSIFNVRLLEVFDYRYLLQSFHTFFRQSGIYA